MRQGLRDRDDHDRGVVAYCERCGAGGEPHFAHVVPAGARALGMPELELEHGENVMQLCTACMRGWDAVPMPLRVARAVLRARIAWASAQGGPS